MLTEEATSIQAPEPSSSRSPGAVTGISHHPAELAGVTLPSPASSADDHALTGVLEAVASTSARFLQDAGYLAPEDLKSVLRAYRSAVQLNVPARQPAPDFVLFTAQALAQKHSQPVEAEIHSMQKLMRWGLSSPVHAWSFGPLPGRATALHQLWPSIRICCMLLNCPAVLVGDEHIVHVASINPVAALAAAAWISQDLALQSGTEAPFVFPFTLELPAWQTMQQRHLAA